MFPRKLKKTLMFSKTENAKVLVVKRTTETAWLTDAYFLGLA